VSQQEQVKGLGFACGVCTPRQCCSAYSHLPGAPDTTKRHTAQASCAKRKRHTAQASCSAYMHQLNLDLTSQQPQHTLTTHHNRPDCIPHCGWVHAAATGVQ
jgi:hypothetical protein